MLETAACRILGTVSRRLFSVEDVEFRVLVVQDTIRGQEDLLSAVFCKLSTSQPCVCLMTRELELFHAF